MSANMYHDDDPVASRFNLGLWRELLVFARPYWRYFLMLGGVALVVAGCDIALPYITGAVIDEVREHATEADLLSFGLAFGVLIMAFALCILAFILICGVIATGVSHDIRRAAFAHLQRLDFAYFDKRPVGWLMARLTSDCNGLARIIGWSMLDLVWGTATLCGVVVVMLWMNWKLGLLVMLIAPPLVLIARYFQWRLLTSSRAMRKANSHVTAGFNEGIAGVRTAKALVREKQSLREFQETSTTMYRESIRNAVYAAGFQPALITLCSAGIGIALWYGGASVMSGGLTLGELVTFIGYAQLVSMPIQEMARTITMVLGAQASAERIQSLLDTPPQIIDSPEVKQMIEGASVKADDGAAVAAREGIANDGLPIAINTIAFDHVSFAYVEGHDVISDFNLEVEAGQTVALVGPTGGGKSTIVSLLCRFYEPTAGQVLINGRDYRTRSLHWLQSNLGMVLQTPHVFSGSIKDNIRYGNLDATDDQIIEAARLVMAHDFITALPEGYDSKVGQGGSQLSTGQKQLISLARAILANPQIFVMDEATSSVDTETEKLIQHAVDRVLEGRIAFVIAHRLSTIKNADVIVVIEDGRIAEKGTHHELIARRGHYYELYTNQFTEEHSVEVLAN